MISLRILKYFILVLLLFALIEPTTAQRWKLRRYEVGAGLGTGQIFGDIGGAAVAENWYGLKDIRFDETRLAVPLMVRYRLDPVYSLKVNAILGFGRATDDKSRNDRDRMYKVLLGEFSAQFEYFFIPEEKRFKSAAMFNRRGMVNNYMSIGAYGFIGIGGTYSRLLSYDTGNPELVRETDVWKNNNIAAIIPFGVGIKYIVSDRWLVNADLGYRYAFSDYVEGFTQTTSSKFNDVYYFLNIAVGYRLETSRRGLPTFLDRDYRAARPKYRRPPGLKNKPRNKRSALK